MSRPLAAAIVAELDQAYLVPVIFAELEFDTDTVRLHDDLDTITWGGFPWQGAGDLASVGPIKETEKLSPSGVALTLSGLDARLLDEARTRDFQDRPVVIYLGIRNSVTGSLVSDPTEIFYGFMDKMTIATAKGRASIEVMAESEQKRWEHAPIEYYDDATLQNDFSGDKFFEFLPRMVNLNLDWGDGKGGVFTGVKGNPAGGVRGGGSKTRGPRRGGG